MKRICVRARSRTPSSFFSDALCASTCASARASPAGRAAVGSGDVVGSDVMRSPRRGCPVARPGLEPFVQPVHAEELVGRVEVFVGRGEREEDGVEPHVALEQLGDRHRAAHAHHAAAARRRSRCSAASAACSAKWSAAMCAAREPWSASATDSRVPGGTCASRCRATRASDRVGILIRHEPAGDLRVRLAGDHGLLPRSLVAAPHAVDLERRPRPLALERRVAGLAERRRRADLREIRLLVVGQRGDRRALGARQLADLVVEPRHGHAAVGLVQRRDEPRHRVERIGHAAAVTARVQVLRGRRQRELEPAQSAARHGERRLVDPPHRAVGRHARRRRPAAPCARAMKASRWRLPISSSPSNMNFTLTGRRPAVAKNASATSIGISIGPLSSDTPRA